MALETATYISGLNANNPVTATDIVREGSDHLRLVKSTILNTFPNITGAMTRTHTQLNNAPDRTVSSNFTVTDAPDLVDNGNALNIGTLAGAHLAFGPAQVQAKASATTAAALALNALGGSVVVGGGGAGAQDLDIGAATGQDARLNLLENGVAQVRLIHDASADMAKLRLINATDRLQLEQGNGSKVMAVFDPDGDFEFYRDGALTLRSTAVGTVQVRNPASGNGVLSIIGGTGTDTTLTKVAGAEFEIKNNENSGNMILRGRDTGGVLTNFAVFDPDGTSQIYADGSVRLTATTDGVDISGTFLDVIAGVNSTTYLRIWNNFGGVALRADVTTGDGQLNTLNGSGGVTGTHIDMEQGGPVTLYYNGAQHLRTAAYAGTDEVSGGEVLDGSGTFRPIGFNVMPQESVSSSISLTDNRAGWAMRITSGTPTITVDSANSDACPIGTTWMIMNVTSTGKTIAQGTSMTLRWLDGGGSSKTGNRTLAGFGVCTITKSSASVFEIWGVGLT